MRRTLLLTAVLAIAAGCPDQSASSRAQSARKLDQAMEQMRRAGIGYVPKEAVAAGQPVSVADYRQATLQQSVEALRNAVEGGSPGQRVSARRMLADVYSSSARHEARRGAAEAAALANRSAALFGYLVAADRADARHASFNTDFSAVMQKLEGELNGATADKHLTQEQLRQLQPQIESLQTRIAGLQARSAELRAKAQEMRRDAFAMEGDAKYDRLDEADAVQRGGDNADFEAQRLTVDLQKLQSLQQDQQRTLAAADQRLALITEVRQKTIERQADTTRLRDEAQADRAAAADGLMAEFKLVADAYDSVVVTTFEKALTAQKQALDELDKAVGEASGQDREMVNADLVGKLLDRAYIIGEYAAAAGEFGRSIDSILVRADSLMPDHAATIAAVRRHVFDRQTRLIQDAGDTTQRARELIGQLRQSAPDGSEMATGLTRQQRALDGYARQLQQVTLDQRA